jgi:menaquinone-specific isochorismate synthase
VRVRLYGGFSFRADHAPEGHWQGFPAARFHLPTLELTGDASGRGRLRGQALAAPDEAPAVRQRISRRLAALHRRLAEAEATAPATGARGHIVATQRTAWGTAVEEVLDAIARGRISKAVLARTLDVTLEGRVGPVELAEALWVRNPGTHVFLFEPVPGRALAGAAPEALATVRSGIFHATAVAGSAARGGDPAADARLAAGLLDSAKDRAEHALVVDDMRRRLEPLAGDIRTDAEPSVLTLARIQHLETGVRARLRAGAHILDLVEALHPTPAVCGVPRDQALELLRTTEPFHRGWYAGPVGWFATDGDGHFVPALRTAVGDGGRWRLYAGAGIVDGSTPQGEWDETAIKFQPILRALASRGADFGDGGSR